MAYFSNPNRLFVLVVGSLVGGCVADNTGSAKPDMTVIARDATVTEDALAGEADAVSTEDAEPSDGSFIDDGSLMFSDAADLTDAELTSDADILSDGAVEQDARVEGDAMLESDAAAMVDAALEPDAAVERDADLPMDAGDDPQPNAVEANQPNRDSRIVGNPNGGRRFDEVCGPSEVLVGVYGGIRPGDAMYLGQLGAICADLRVNDGAVSRGADRDLPVRGGGGGGAPVRSVCPGDQAVVQFSGRAGNLVDQLVLRCAGLTVDDGVLSWARANPLLPVGGQGGDPLPVTGCEDDEIAVGAIIRAGDGLDGFGLICNQLQVVD